MLQHVVLVDESGNPTGTVNVMEAHMGTGQLHKAFSVYVFRRGRSELLIQKRAEGKMLWPGAWANTCCSHPREGETPLEAGTRRLMEELGFTCDLTEAGHFIYRAEDPAGRGVEHEHVTLLVGNVSDSLSPAQNPSEVAEWKWVAIGELQKDMTAHPDAYAPWFPMGLPKVLS